MSAQILVTGAHGFIGQNLVKALNKAGMEPHGPELDLHDYGSIKRSLEGSPWDVVIHLAAISNIPKCEKDPELAYRANLNGTALLLEAIRETKLKPHFIFASTAQVYAAPSGAEVSEGVVFDEARAIAPQNLYARTKWQAELLLQDFASRYELPITILRLFNHTHKTQGPDFFLPHLYHSILALKPGESISVGNLDLERDIGGIQDLLQALTLVTNAAPSPGKAEVFNVCSGRSKTLRELAEKLATKLGVKTTFQVDPSRVRAGEAKSICGSNLKLTAATGWAPKALTADDLIKSFLNESVV